MEIASTYITAMAKFAHCKAASDLVGFGESQPLIVVAFTSQVLDGAAPQVDVHSQLDGERVVKQAKSFKKRCSFQCILDWRVGQPAFEHPLAPEEKNALQGLLPLLFHRWVEVRSGKHPASNSLAHEQIAAQHQIREGFPELHMVTIQQLPHGSFVEAGLLYRIPSQEPSLR